jgi:hypothetical protein
VLERYQPLLLQGSVLVDETDQAVEPRLLVYLEHAIRDGRAGRSGEPRAISQRLVKSLTGFPIQSPYVSIANRQAEIMMRNSAEFGFTPASRGRITVAAEPERTLFDELEKG